MSLFAPFLFAALVLLAAIPANVLSVQDGDTLTIEAELWPGLSQQAIIRLRGIDAPELKAECETARLLAAQARQRLAELAGQKVMLRNIQPGLYGRFIADVMTGTGENIASLLLQEKLARKSAHKRADWC